MSKRTESYVMCIRTDLSLVIESTTSARSMSRGNDYLYPASWFVAVHLPEESAQAQREARANGSSKRRVCRVGRPEPYNRRLHPFAWGG